MEKTRTPEKIACQQDRSAFFKLGKLPQKTTSAIYHLMRCSKRFIDNVSEAISDNIEKAAMTSDNHIFRSAIKEEYKKIYREKFYPDVTGQPFPDEGPDNTHIVERTVENLCGQYISALKGVMKVNKPKWQDDIFEDNSDKVIVEMLMASSDETEIHPKLEKKIVSAKKKDKKDEWQKVLDRYDYIKAKTDIEWTYTTLLYDHIARECARSMFEDGNKPKFCYANGNKFAKQVVDELWGSERVKYEYEKYLHCRTLEAYWNEENKYFFLENQKKNKKIYEARQIIDHFIENEDAVKAETEEYMVKVAKEFGESGGCKFRTENILYLVNSVSINKKRDEEKCPIFKVTDIPQYAKAGIDRIGECKYVIKLKLFTVGEMYGTTYMPEAFSGLYDRHTNQRYDLIDRARKGSYVYLPIYISDKDSRKWSDRLKNTFTMSAFSISERKTKKDGRTLCVNLSYTHIQHKPRNYFKVYPTYGVDINVKHSLFSTNATNLKGYIDVNGELIDFYNSIGRPDKLKNINLAVTLGDKGSTAGNHTNFLLVSDLGDWDDHGKKRDDRFVKREDGTYYSRPDLLADGLNFLRKKYSGDRKSYDYLNTTIAFRNNQTRLRCIDKEWNDRKRAYDEEHGKPEKGERSGFYLTEDADRLTRERQALRREIAENTRQVIAYILWLFQENGIKSIALEHLDCGSWKKFRDQLKPKWFCNSCKYWAEKYGIPYEATKYYRSNRKYFDIEDGELIPENVKLNALGETENDKRYFQTNIAKAVGMSSIKQMFSIVSQNYDIQVNYTDQAYTSQTDSRNGTVDRDFRVSQECYIGSDGTKMNCDFNAAVNIADRISDDTLREEFNKELPMKEFVKYGATQIVSRNRKWSSENAERVTMTAFQKRKNAEGGAHTTAMKPTSDTEESSLKLVAE